MSKNNNLSANNNKNTFLSIGTFSSRKQKLKINVIKGKPVKLLKDRSDMFCGKGSGNDKRSSILDQLNSRGKPVWIQLQ